MGASTVTEAVADAGPIIHLFEIARLSLLDVFDRVHVPQAVWGETVERGRVPAEALASIAGIARTPADFIEAIFFRGLDVPAALHEGEVEALAVCRQRGVELILTDDLAVRDVARKLSLVPVGSLGIVVRAARIGRISMDAATENEQPLCNPRHRRDGDGSTLQRPGRWLSEPTL